MVNLTIDNINVSVPEGTTIMDAAKMADIPIPKLCYLKDINEIFLAISVPPLFAVWHSE